MKKIKGIGSLLLVFCMVFAMLPGAVFASGTEIDITGIDVSTIKSAIEMALADNDTVIVTGTKTEVVETLKLTIPAGKTVVWQAEYKTNLGGSFDLIELGNTGTFTVGSGGNIYHSADDAIFSFGCKVIVSGAGSVRSMLNYAIKASGDVTVSDDAIVRSENSMGIYALGSNSTVLISGGTVEAKAYPSAISVPFGNVMVESGTVKNRGAGNAINSQSGNVTVSGGVVRATTGYAISTTGEGSDVNVSGGVVFAYGSSIEEVINSDRKEVTNDALIIRWAKPADSTPTYEAGDATNISWSDNTDETTAVWAKNGDDSGIFYKNNTNTGFLAIEGVTVNETSGPITHAETPNILTPPQSVAYTQGESATPLSVTVAPLTDGGTFSFQWYSNTANSTTAGTAVGTNSNTYTPSTAAVGTTYYYCVVTNTNSSASENQTATATSYIAAITVNAATGGTVTGTMEINGTEVISDLKTDATGAGWIWRASAATLALTSDYVSSNAISIKCAPTDTINLAYSGNVNISVAGTAFNSNGALNIIGSGALTLTNTTDLNYALLVINGNLNISGGTLTATGPTGIYSNKGDIIIGSSANVTAVSTGGSGTNAGISANGGYNIFINGGTVNATGKGMDATDGALIADNITISGGNVGLSADIAANYAIADGGTLTITDGATVKIGSTQVYLTTLTLDGVDSVTAVAAITSPVSGYAIVGKSTRTDGKLCFLLPAGNQTVTLTAGGNAYTGTVNVTSNHGATVTLAQQGVATYTISGTITGNDTGSGIGNAVVSLHDGTDIIGGTHTNPDGTYTLPAVPSGTYSIEVGASGYNSATITGIVVSDTNVTGQNLTLAKTSDTTTHAVTVNGSYATPTGAGSYAKDTTVSIYAGNRSNYTFTGWTSSDVTITNASSKNASFVMPDKAVTVTANWSYNGGGSYTPPVTTPPAPPATSPNQPAIATASVTATVDSNGTASANIPASVIIDAVARAQSMQGSSANGIAVALNVTMPQGAPSFTAALPQSALQSLVTAGVSQLQISGAPVSLGLNLGALQSIQNQASGGITIGMTPATGLSAPAQSMIGNRPVYNITIGYTDNDGHAQSITSFGSGSANLAIPYTPGINEAPGNLFGVYVDGNGNASRIPGSTYDANAGAVIIPTDHLSIYGVGYEAPAVKFIDISKHWAKESIEYVAAKGLVSGITETTFAPNTTMTRGMLVTVLGRLAEVDAKAYSAHSFTDVTKGKYYAPYIEWAYSKGIVKGIGNSRFAPDRAVTREEMAVILANYTKAVGNTLPVSHEATTYADNNRIGDIFKTSVIAMQQGGIMIGDTNNQFNPKSGATRAEFSAMIKRYIELVIE